MGRATDVGRKVRRPRGLSCVGKLLRRRRLRLSLLVVAVPRRRLTQSSRVLLVRRRNSEGRPAPFVEFEVAIGGKRGEVSLAPVEAVQGKQSLDEKSAMNKLPQRLNWAGRRTERRR